MKQVKMTLPDYPMFMYFMNMYCNSQPPTFVLSMEGPATKNIQFVLSFTDPSKEPDIEFLHKMFAASGGTSFTIAEATATTA